MLGRQMSQALAWRQGSICLFCAARTRVQPLLSRPFATSRPLSKNKPVGKLRRRLKAILEKERNAIAEEEAATEQQDGQDESLEDESATDTNLVKPKAKKKTAKSTKKTTKAAKKTTKATKKTTKATSKTTKKAATFPGDFGSMSLKDALLSATSESHDDESFEPLEIRVLYPEALAFTPVEVEKPPVPMLSYGLDRVLFNPGVYRLQDTRSRVYNFDPYLEKIMPVKEFNFDALSEYKTSSKDQDLLAMTKKTGAKYTGSTSSMSGILQHFHYGLSSFRPLNHGMLSRDFPSPSNKFSRITLGPSAVFLRYKDGAYAIDDDKSYDSPNIMSWLGHSLEKLLTTERSEFERFRRSNTETPAEENSSRCYHYTKQGNILMRSQLDAYDPRLPGTGIFDLKTRAVVSIRMDHKEYEKGAGYQLRHSTGKWESFEREFYDMTRATLLKYSLQVRMGRMDGIFIAFHNVDRIFGFQYLSLADLDEVLHGQRDTTLGDQEFKLSIALVDEIISKATAQFPNTSLRLHVEARPSKTSFLYIFAEPVTEEQADKIQSEGDAQQKEFARTVVGIGNNDQDVQAAWRKTQDEVDEQLAEDQRGAPETETPADETELHEAAEEEAAEETDEEANEEVIEENGEAAEEEVNEETDDAVEEEAIEETDDAVEEGIIDETDDAVEEGVIDETDEDASEETDEDDIETDEDASEETEDGHIGQEETNKVPLMGWTLTVRSKVNDSYVTRPSGLSSEDSWELEYYIKEIPEVRRWKLYDALKQRRRDTVGQTEDEVDEDLKFYRGLIHRYSEKGKEWRQQQDEINKNLGVTVYRPMGPGSGAGQHSYASGAAASQAAEPRSAAEAGAGDGEAA